MARNTTLDLPTGQWVELTSADVTAITFQCLMGEVYVKATDGATPTDVDGSIVYNVGQGERNMSLADIYPGVSGAVRVFAKGKSGAQVFVSHA